ncbi:MAG: hypothetical protein JXR58_03370 [Bacteroidales bacterium]|nr:hypothetical protein [Bacteroidales bacterium]
MKTIILSTMLIFLLATSCKNEDGKKTDSTDKPKEKVEAFTVDSKGLEINDIYFSLNDTKNKIEEAVAPFGSRLYVVMNEFKGFKEVEGKYKLGSKISLYDGEKLLRQTEDLFANDEGIKVEDFSNIYAYIDIYYPVVEGKEYKFVSELWDKNSENKASVVGIFTVKGKAPGDFEVSINNASYAAILLNKGDEVAVDNVYHPGELIKLIVEGFSGFVNNGEGYSFVGSHNVTDEQGNIIVDNTSQEISIEKMDRLFSSLPVYEVPKSATIIWNVNFKDNNSDAEITVKTKIRLEP